MPTHGGNYRADHQDAGTARKSCHFEPRASIPARDAERLRPHVGACRHAVSSGRRPIEGALGHAVAMGEAIDQLAAQKLVIDAMVFASSSAGTQAGLVLG